jgi:hypothetical protein
VLDVSHRQSAYGQPITFTATVTVDTSTAPSGVVEFSDNGILIGMIPVDATGVATLVLTSLEPGTHKVQAVFRGNVELKPAHVVIQVKPAATLTTLSANPSPSMFGQQVTFTATVTADSGVPTGSVVFTIDGTRAGTAIVDPNGAASLVVSRLGAGPHTIEARFVATEPFRSSNAAPLTHLVTAHSEHIIVVGTESAPGHVKVFDAGTQELLFSFLPYGGFSGGVRVAAGDVNGDGTADILTVSDGATSAAHVRVFSGVDLSELHSFLPFSGATGGVSVAAGDVNGDGRADIIVGAAINSHVKAFDSATLAELGSFLAYPGFLGGVTVAAGDINNDGFADIITGAGASVPHVKVFDGLTNAELRSFLAYPAFPGGVTVAAGDVNNDGFDDIITGAGGSAPHVKVFDGVTSTELRSFLAYGGGFIGGVRVGASDVNDDGVAEIVTAPAGAVPHVKVFDGTSLAELASFLAFDTLVGIHIGGQ